MPGQGPSQGRWKPAGKPAGPGGWQGLSTLRSGLFLGVELPAYTPSSPDHSQPLLTQNILSRKLSPRHSGPLPLGSLPWPSQNKCLLPTPPGLEAASQGSASRPIPACSCLQIWDSCTVRALALRLRRETGPLALPSALVPPSSTRPGAFALPTTPAFNLPPSDWLLHCPQPRTNLPPSDWLLYCPQLCT